MGDSTMPWRNTTHDWASTVDTEHLSAVRELPEVFAPGGQLHLILEVIAYAADEAEAAGSTGSARCVITLHGDGSVSVSDNGRGTDTRYDDDGLPVRKPVMATKDLRFFDSPDAELLPDGHPRRGMSVVAALSEWLIHTNRRRNGAWTQRYEYGIPVSDLVPVDHAAAMGLDDDDGGTGIGTGIGTGTGTTVRFLPVEPVRTAATITAATITAAARARLNPWPHLAVEVSDERTR